MRILVIGAAGQVGSVLLDKCRRAENVSALGADIKSAEGIARADITDAASLKTVFDDFRPDWTILSSALTAVDYCEAHPEEAGKINAEGVRIVRERCDACGGRLLFLSTEYVFDGKSGPYSETDPVNPLSVYAKSKLRGELFAAQARNGFIIARSTVIYNYDPRSINFAMQLINRLPKGERMTVPSDQYSNPTYAPDLAEALLRLINLGGTGIYNVVGADRLNRYEFAMLACQVLGLDGGLITPKTTAELNQKAPRPLYAGLRTDKLKKDAGFEPRGAAQGLACVKKLWEADKTK